MLDFRYRLEYWLKNLNGVIFDYFCGVIILWSYDRLVKMISVC